MIDAQLQDNSPNICVYKISFGAVGLTCTYKFGCSW